MNSGTELASALFQNLVDTKPTRVKLGHGSFITIDFGRDISEVYNTRTGPKTRCYGEWRFWIYMCAWRIDRGSVPIAGCEDSREKIEICLTELAKRELKEVIILNNAFDAKFIFEDDIELHLFSFYTQERDQWMLFTPEKKVFTAGPGCEWSYSDSDKS